MRISPLRLSLVMCLAEVLGMTGFSTFPALLPGFMAEWSLSHTQAGWINGILYGGYVLAVPVLASLTDRIPAKRVYFLSMALSAAACGGFALLADGFWTGLLFRGLIGVGLAGTYMPGLKILSDEIEGPAKTRAIAFYTASFSIGAALSFMMAGEITALAGWRWAAAAATLGPLLAILLSAPLLPRDAPRPPVRPETHLLDFRPVLTCRPAMGYVLAYAAHNFELFNLRSWMVAYLVFAQGFGGAGADFWSATAIATWVTVLGLPASVIGNELSNRYGRNRVITLVMALSALLSCAVGFLAGVAPFWLIIVAFAVYGVTVTADSASITAGAVVSAPKNHLGATMAVHSCIGFSGAFLGPLIFGVVLDAGDAVSGLSSWGLAFVVTGCVVALGPVAVARLSGRR